MRRAKHVPHDLDTPSEDRREARRKVHIVATCRQAFLRIPASLINITRDGCCIETATRNLKAGEPVKVQPQGLSGFPGTVRWVDGSRAGIRFERDLYEPVFDHLVRHHAINGQSAET
jgi:hypothetical protein